MFTRSQRNGLIVLGILIVLSLLSPLGFKFFKKDYSSSFKAFEQEIESAKKEKAKPKELFSFNPNTATKAELSLLGLNPKQVHQIINFKEKVTDFKTKKDFAKIYAIDSLTYQTLEAYIDLPDSIKVELPYKTAYKEPSNKQIKKKYKAPKPVVVDLNTAKEEEIQAIKGIGPAFSKRIVKYRNALGGFVSKKQLLEVYGIDDELMSKIESQILIKASKVELIKVNFESAKEIEKHPYFSKALAKELVKNRSFNGRYKDLNDLKKRLKIDTELSNKIKDYIRF
jgi:competence ComEA-like helix-hairpin-helix protein